MEAGYRERSHPCQSSEPASGGAFPAGSQLRWAPMRDRTNGIVTSWAFIFGCLLALACGGGGTTSPDAGPPDGGTGDEVTPSACSVPVPTTCPDPAPRYADVAPIFQQRCVTCHAGNPGGPWSLADYGPVSDWQD